MGSRNPRKIGMGVPNILGFVEWGCRKMGVPIFFVTPARSSTLEIVMARLYSGLHYNVELEDRMCYPA